MQSPNRKSNIGKHRQDPYSLGENQLSRFFKWPFETLLTPEYYAGSEYGKIFYERRADGRSKIYVDQPNLEKELQDYFIDDNNDFTKYLVGYTGVGKTTLLRNFFQVFDRDINVIDGNLVIYVSLYSMASSEKGTEEDLIRNMLDGAIQEAISFIDGREYIERLQSYDDSFYKDLYAFILANNKHMIHTYAASPDNSHKLHTPNPHTIILNDLAQAKPFDYNLSLLKYYLFKSSNGDGFKNVIFILDDVESLSLTNIEKLIDIVHHIKKCMQANKKRQYNIKSLIALRNYSFRNLPQEIKNAAFRERGIVIHKDTVPRLSKVIKLRLEYLMSKPETIQKYSNKDALTSAYNSLDFILQSLYGQYDEMLLSLTHNNLFLSMHLLFRIITNKQFIGKNEVEERGAFDIRHERYLGRGPKASSLRNDDVFYALAYGENDVYKDEEDYYFTNILHFKENDHYQTELCGLFIIQYLYMRKVYFSENGYDYVTSIDNREVIDDIVNQFSFPIEKRKHDFKSGLHFMMRHMYIGGAILQSILEPKYDDGPRFRRIFHDDMKIYLSRRGFQLYKMLEKNALLLMVYRDDIDTDIENNDKSTLSLSNSKSIQYCIKYIEHLFNLEVALTKIIVNKAIYISTIGSTLPTVQLMKGIRESINIYFNEASPDRDQTIILYNQLAEKMQKYIVSLSENGRYKFDTVYLIK